MTAVVAVATALVGAFWACAAVGLADAGWWPTAVVSAVVAFAAAALALALWNRS